MTIRRSSRLMRRSVSMTTCAFIGSRLAMGSSARMMRGSCISARAIATRCCWPPDSASARLVACSAMPSRSRISSAFRISARGQRLNMVCTVVRRFRMPCRTFDATSIRGTRLNCWKIIAQDDCQVRAAAPFSASTLRPSTRISPELASISRFIRRRKVDLPAPERPMMPTKAGVVTLKLTLSTAAFWPNIRVTPLTSSIATPVKLERGANGPV